MVNNVAKHFRAVYSSTIYSTWHKTSQSLGSVVVNVRGVHINRGSVSPGGKREKDSPHFLVLFRSFIWTSASLSQGDISLFFFFSACQLVPLWCLLYTFYSIWTAGPARGERNPSQNPNCVPLSNTALLSLKEKRIKNSCYIYSGKEGKPIHR